VTQGSNDVMPDDLDDLLANVDERQLRLERRRPWPMAAAERLWQGLTAAWIAGSNALDGNRLTLDQTQALLADGTTLDSLSLREHLEVLGHRQAIAEVRRLSGSTAPICASQVRRLHRLLFEEIDPESAGRYRRYQLQGAPASVPDQMRAWELWLAGSAQGLHPLFRAAVAHARLASIQPFLDGSGRVARLVMNLSLLRDGYVPALLRYEDRHDYRQALYRAENGDTRALLVLVAGAVQHVQTMFLLVLD
jgi:Fic family protein